MLDSTREQFDRVLLNTVKANGLKSIDRISSHFTVAPVPAQNMEKAIQQSSAFLSEINSGVLVQNQSGQVIGLGSKSRNAQRNAPNTERNPTDPTDTAEKYEYRCEKTNYDVAISYEKLDLWAHLPNFQEIFNQLIVEQEALDRICIGLNGTSVVSPTDLVKNPMLQDVNIGWLEKMRRAGSKGYLPAAASKNQKIWQITDTGTGDYINLDQMVFDMNSMLDPWYRSRSDLVVLTGYGMLHDKYLKLIGAAGNDTVKQVARDMLLANVTLGGRPVYQVPFFPENALCLTTFKNLSIYAQAASRRRLIRDEPNRDRVVNYNSVNEAFVVEDMGLAVFAENIQLLDAGKTAEPAASTPASTDDTTGKTGG